MKKKKSPQPIRFLGYMNTMTKNKQANKNLDIISINESKWWYYVTTVTVNLVSEQSEHSRFTI